MAKIVIEAKDKNKWLSEDERKELMFLVGKEQVEMLMEDVDYYTRDRYKKLELLKLKIRSL